MGGSSLQVKGTSLGGAGVCCAHYADDDPENVSAALGGRRKQARLSQGLHTELIVATVHLCTTFEECHVATGGGLSCPVCMLYDV